ncbi:MAG: alpha/beta hydrolase [Pirellulaceae bacterium]
MPDCLRGSLTFMMPTRNVARRYNRYARLLILALVLGLTVMWLENSLVFPAPRYPEGVWQPAHVAVEDVYFQSADGTPLHGWFIDHPDPVALVLYCHGNGEHLGFLDWLFAEFHERGWLVFAFDYRGYGRSGGRATEAGVLADGHAALSWMTSRLDVTPADIVIMGRSIGGAVAVDLAAAHGARALVLESTFTSVPDVAARWFWNAPIRWLLRTRFDSESRIRQYSGPLFQSHGTADTIVPLDLGERLFAACPSADKEFLAIPGINHNELSPPAYYAALERFLARHPASRTDRVQ